MKLKTFDIFDMLDGINREQVEAIRKEIAPFCLYAPEKHGMAICVMEQKDNILSVIRKYGEKLGLKVRVQGNFVNLSTQLVGDNVDWDDIQLGHTQINSDDFWKEAVNIIESCEERLLEAEDFGFEWRCIKKEALKVVIDKWYEEQKRELEQRYKSHLQAWRELKEVPLF